MRWRPALRLLDSYGPLWLAIVAVIVTCYLWGPCIRAVEQHDENQRQEQAEQEQREIDRTVEYLERLKSRPATTGEPR